MGVIDQVSPHCAVAGFKLKLNSSRYFFEKLIFCMLLVPKSFVLFLPQNPSMMEDCDSVKYSLALELSGVNLRSLTEVLIFNAQR